MSAKQWLVPFTAGCLFTILLTFFQAHIFVPVRPLVGQSHEAKDGAASLKAPVENLWAELGVDEVTKLHEFLYERKDLSLTRSPNGYGAEIYISDVEVLRPKKSNAVAYLDHGRPKPARFARVTLVESKDDEAFFCEYKVGPLPPSSETEILPLEYSHASDRYCTQTAITDVWAFYFWLTSIASDVEDMTSDLLGAKTNFFDLFDPDSLYVGARPTRIEAGTMVIWLEFFRNGARSDARSLLPQGIYAKLTVPSPDPDTWTVGEWSYDGVVYPDIESFRSAWHNAELNRTTINFDGPWTDTEDVLASPAGRLQPPPLSIQPYGPRYQLDREAAYVSWMGFSFFFATSPARALSLHDVRFNESRIIYELGLQEALAHYAGSEPMQSGLEFLDTFFGMGNDMMPLVPGHDCPAYADYLDMTYHKDGGSSTNKNAICIFEFTSDAPLQRHTAALSATVSRNTYLVIRSVSTVGNYDYTIDYILYLDGSIEVKVRASGYIFGAYAGDHDARTTTAASAAEELRPRSPHNRNSKYGYKIHPAVSTSMHDHVLLFRADIDVVNASSNTFQTVSVEPVTKAYPWDLPEAPVRNTMHLVKNDLIHEAGLDWPPNSKSMYLIQSNETNAWGEKRSFRIQPGTGMGTPSHLTIINSTALGKSAVWAEHDIWVLKQHDFEPLAAHERNYLDPKDPLVDFSYLADNELLNEKGEGDDLVVLFNLGGHHVPHSGDIPNTLMHTSASSVMLSPFNYFDEDVSKQFRQGVRINGVDNPHEDGWKKGVKWFGGRYSTDDKLGSEKVLRLNVRKELEPDLSGYFEEDGEDIVPNKVAGGIFAPGAPRQVA
jgi:primary-amine oxidase